MRLYWFLVDDGVKFTPSSSGAKPGVYSNPPEDRKVYAGGVVDVGHSIARDAEQLGLQMTDSCAHLDNLAELNEEAQRQTAHRNTPWEDRVARRGLKVVQPMDGAG